MMNLFDDEEIMKSYIRSERYEAAKEAAKEAEQNTIKEIAVRMIKAQKMTLEEIADCTELPLDFIRDLQTEIMQPS